MKKIVLLIAGLFAAALLVGAAFVGWLVWQRLNVPLYTFAQQVTPDGMFANSYLSSGGVSYVSTRVEFSLDLAPAAFGYPLIGRTSDDQQIRAVPGNTDYISYSGFMNPTTIFRKESVPPIDLATLPVTEIRYVGNRGVEQVRKSSREPQLIADVLRGLQGELVMLPATSQVYHLELVSPDLPGLVYSMNVLIDSSGKVYFAQRYDSEHGVEAGPLFVEWIND